MTRTYASFTLRLTANISLHSLSTQIRAKPEAFRWTTHHKSASQNLHSSQTTSFSQGFENSQKNLIVYSEQQTSCDKCNKAGYWKSSKVSFIYIALFTI